MTENTGNTLSVSLLNRKIYSVRCTGFEPAASFHDALYAARRRFFETGKTVRVHEKGIYNGQNGTLKGKLKRRSFKWEKRAGRVVLETAFQLGGQRGIAFYTPGGILVSRVYFDREQHWLRTEYFAPDNSTRAKTSFKAEDTRDAVVRFDYSDSTGKTKETTLFPAPYSMGSAEQSLQNAQFGDALLLISDETGEYCYCPREEQQKRIKFLKSNKNASVLLSMGWEVKDGEVAAELDDTRNPDYIFDSIEESVRLNEPDAPETILEELFSETRPKAVSSAAPKAEPDGAASLVETLGISEEEAAYVHGLLSRVLKKPAVPNGAADPAEARALTLVRDGDRETYTGHLENGLREGFGRTENENGVTVYEGEYKNDRREGFGVHHYRSGAVSYIGDFKEDSREGFGVSFREEDHALHVSRWENGAPVGFATLFDPEGALRFSGKMVDGKKQGVGVSVNAENSTVFVGKYRDDEMTGEGALFDEAGNLLYMGAWKDGMRHGRGTQFDAAGDVVYAGEFENDRYKNGILYKKVAPGDA